LDPLKCCDYGPYGCDYDHVHVRAFRGHGGRGRGDRDGNDRGKSGRGRGDRCESDYVVVYSDCGGIHGNPYEISDDDDLLSALRIRHTLARTQCY
jgi:hypothetical protein